MLKMIVTDAGVSKGYDGAPALRFIDLEGGGQCVRFRIGKRVYDSRCENNHRWINLSVKAFGEVCERIKKMKLKEAPSSTSSPGTTRRLGRTRTPTRNGRPRCSS